MSRGCSTPCRAQDGPTIKNDLVPNVNVAEAEKPWPEASLSRTLSQVKRVNEPCLTEHLSKQLASLPRDAQPWSFRANKCLLL